MALRNEDVKKSLSLVVTNSNSGEVQSVVHLNDQQVGTTSTPKNMTVTNNLTVRQNITAVNSGSFGALLITGNALLSGSTVVSDLHSLTNALVFGHRLTLTTGVPITMTDVVGATTILLTQYTSNMIALNDGTTWVIRQTNEASLALGTLISGNNYDVFAAWNGSAVTLEIAAWSTDTARATNLARQDGIFVKSGDITRRYVGTFRTTSTTTTEDSISKRFVWNNYNQANRMMRVIEGTGSWAYTTAAFRQTNASTSNKVEYVTGDASSLVKMTAMSIYYCATAAIAALGGVGIDSTTVNSAQIYGGNNATVGIANKDAADYRGYPGLGYHAANWLEYGGANVTFIGNFALSTAYQSGMNGEIMG